MNKKNVHRTYSPDGNFDFGNSYYSVGLDEQCHSRSMDVYLTKIRKLFAEDLSIEIRNIHGHGFMLEIKTT